VQSARQDAPAFFGALSADAQRPTPA